MIKLKLLWQRLEKIAIYSVLLVLITLQLIASFIPKVALIMDAHGSLLLLATVFLFFFRYIDERIGDKKKSALEIEKSFTQGILEVFGNKTEIESVDIFTQTGQKYLYALVESGVKIKRLRILLRSFDQFETIQFPPDEIAKIGLKQESFIVIKTLQDLQKQGSIKNLTIKYYSFDPSFYFLIADDRSLHFGLFQPVRNTQGIKVLTSFNANNNTSEGAKLTDDFKTFFESVYKDFSTPIERSKDNSHSDRRAYPPDQQPHQEISHQK